MTGTLYVESSALLRALLEGDSGLREILLEAQRCATSELTFIEADRGLRRAVREKRIAEAQRLLAEKHLREFAASCETIALDRSVFLRARQEFPVEPVRTLDALHLASVLEWSEAVEAVTVASCDDRIRRNAQAWGMAVLPSAR